MNKALQELQLLRHQQYLMYLLVFSLVTIVIWVGVSLFVSQKKQQVDTELTELAIPLNPTINTAAIEALEQKVSYDPALTSEFPIYIKVVQETGQASTITTVQEERNRRLEPEPTPTPLPTPLPETAESVTPEATGSSETTPTPTPTTTPPTETEIIITP